MNSLLLIKQTINLILFVIISWIIIHLMAVFGLFLVVTIPILQFFFAGHITCFYCQLTHSKHSLSHILKSAILILIATIFSLGIVYGETRLLHYFGLPFTQKTVEFVIPDRNEYKIGEIFPMKLEIKGIKTPINVVRTDIQFDPTMIEVVGIDTNTSFATIFIQKEINNVLGYARLTGGIPNPGWNQPTGVFGTVYLRGKSAGPIVIDFLPTSQVLANNGQGTNVLLNLAKASYYIKKDKINPDQIKLQEEIIQRYSQVLGESTIDSTQLTFTGYADPIPPLPHVLGATTSTTVSTPSDPSIHPFLKLIQDIDNVILNFWTNLTSKIANLFSF